MHRSRSSRRRIVLLHSSFFTKCFKGTIKRRSFWLLLVSEASNKVASHASQTCCDWWSLNGWTSNDIVRFLVVIMGVCVLWSVLASSDQW
jgi:hypothetical protein